MKTVVITGSTRGLGFEMAKLFRQNNWNVVLNGVNTERLEKALETLRTMPGGGQAEGFAGSVADTDDLQIVFQIQIRQRYSDDGALVSEAEIDAVLNIDLRGAVMGSRLAALQMEKQPEGGFIYNIEGYGSNDAMMLGLNLYGTSKRAVTHFTRAFAGELEERGSKVKAGRLSPGIMITDFTVKSLGGKEAIDLPEKTKKVYNILGDYPDVVAAFLVKGMLANRKNNAKIEWLTTGKAAWRFMTAGFNKRNFFD